MKRADFSLLLLTIATIAGTPVPAQAERLTKREVAEFTGVYAMKARNTLIADGMAYPFPSEFEVTVRLNESGGNGVQESPGGSYRPVQARVAIGSRTLRVRQILSGDGVDPESGQHYVTFGTSTTTLTRRSPRKFTARRNFRISFGSIATIVQRANGIKIR